MYFIIQRNIFSFNLISFGDLYDLQFQIVTEHNIFDL